MSDVINESLFLKFLMIFYPFVFLGLSIVLAIGILNLIMFINDYFEGIKRRRITMK